MSAQLREDQKLRRAVKVYGIEGLVYVTLTSNGIEFKVPRTKVGVTVTWPQAVKACQTPSNVPSKFEGDPIKFLIDQAEKVTKRAVKKAQKEGA
jgi:hypothetical protein